MPRCCDRSNGGYNRRHAVNLIPQKGGETTVAQRRMFSIQIIDTDAFMDMPLSAQALYFHLGMRADDDGFVSNARRIQKLVGAADDDLKLLILKRFVLTFDSGVIVLKHWKISNYIQKDRYKPTLYREEKATLYLKPDGAYTDHPSEGARPCIQSVSKEDTEEEKPAIPAVCTDVSILDTQDRLGKDRLGKVRLGEVNNNSLSGGGDARAREAAESAVANYLGGRNLDASLYFGVTEQDLATVAAYTDAIFARFARRQPTDADRANVFQVTHMSERDEQSGTWTVSFPPNRIELLMYAFEQAALAGKPGDWKYINGVLGRLAQRGISTLGQAEEYDIDRDENKGAF